MGAEDALIILEKLKMSSLTRIRTPDRPPYSLATISSKELSQLVSLIRLHRKNGFALKKNTLTVNIKYRACICRLVETPSEGGGLLQGRVFLIVKNLSNK